MTNIMGSLPQWCLIFLIISVNSNLIAFSSDGLCPEGWEIYNFGQCRTIVLQGSTTLNGKNYTCPLLERGGEFEHILSVDELPEHQHKQGSQALYNRFGGGISVGLRGPNYNGYPTFIEQLTSSVGSSKPFNIRNPYIVLTACIQSQKIKQTQNQPKQHTDSFNSNDMIKIAIIGIAISLTFSVLSFCFILKNQIHKSKAIQKYKQQ